MLRLQRNIIIVVVLILVVAMHEDSADLLSSISTKTQEFIGFTTNFGSVISFSANIIIQSFKQMFV